jgi:hypothetical protein
VSNASTYGASGPSVAIVFAAPNNRFACSNEAAATGIFGEPERRAELRLTVAFGQDQDGASNQPTHRARIVPVQTLDELLLIRVEPERLPEEVALRMDQDRFDPPADRRTEAR